MKKKLPRPNGRGSFVLTGVLISLAPGCHRRTNPHRG